MKQLKAQARKQSIPRYYEILKPELIKALATPTPPTVPYMNILDEKIPEINVPILKPSQPIRNSPVPSLKHLASKVFVSVNKKINKFSDWILSYVPEPIQKTVNERVDSLKKKVNQIYKKLNKVTPKEQETA